MTENEAIEVLKKPCLCDYDLSATIESCEVSSCDRRDAARMAIQALEEIQQYRAIGTVEELEAMKKGTLSAMEMADIWCVLEDLKKYSAIGTIEEFKALKEKLQDVEITIINRMQEFYDEYRSISQSSVDHFGGKADAIETSQKIVKGVFKDLLGLDWSE